MQSRQLPAEREGSATGNLKKRSKEMQALESSLSSQ